MTNALDLETMMAMVGEPQGGSSPLEMLGELAAVMQTIGIIAQHQTYQTGALGVLAGGSRENEDGSVEEVPGLVQQQIDVLRSIDKRLSDIDNKLATANESFGKFTGSGALKILTGR